MCARHWQGHRNSVVRSLKCSWQQSRPGVTGREGEGQMDGWIERGERSRHAGTKHTEWGALWSICCRRWDDFKIRTCTYDKEVCLSVLFLSVCATYRHYRTSDNSRSSIMDRACRVNLRLCISAPVWMQYVLSICLHSCLQALLNISFDLLCHFLRACAGLILQYVQEVRARVSLHL